MSTPASLPYHEPSPLTILTQSTFLLLLNSINYILNRTISCDLVGQILIGVAWGTPGWKILGTEVENVVVQLGYLGLVLLVYEGGLNTSLPTLLHNLRLSTAIAITGISLPIGLSYLLLPLTTPSATALQAFAAGAALCSTSLGTTFTVLNASGLVRTRMGVVLSTAAMLDDVVGLVVVRVITDLGRVEGEGFSAATVLRPVGVSVAFAVVVPGVCWVGGRPLAKGVHRFRDSGRGRRGGVLVRNVLGSEGFALSVQTLLLLGMVVGNSYAGTSNLFAAYLAGAVVSWWDGLVECSEVIARPSDGVDVGGGVQMERIVNPEIEGEDVNREFRGSSSAGPGSIQASQAHPTDQQTQSQSITLINTTGTHIFTTYYESALQRILKPFFFASIGFSIPITQMFQSDIVWRGLVYSLLMFTGKLACGLWLVRFPGISFRVPSWTKRNETTQNDRKSEDARDNVPETTLARNNEDEREIRQSNATDQEDREWQRIERPKEAAVVDKDDKSTQLNPKIERHPDSESKRKPLSLYPGLIVGGAMTARGEIGFLISSLAQSNGIFDVDSSSPATEGESSPIFLIVTWAIMLCTIVGPVVVGVLVRRVRELESNATRVDGNSTGKEKNVLGV